MENDLMIHGRSNAAKLSDDTLSVNVTVESVLGKSKKSRKKNRWRPYTPIQWLRNASGRLERIPSKEITDLPDELVVRVLSNLNIKDISVCRSVNHKWHALVDELHLQALAFTRFLQYQPTPQPQTVENYHLSTRSWLRDFGIRGKELAEQLDELLEH